MLFTSFDYILFLVLVFSAYWLIRNKTAQNILLLVVSYIFYGYVSPWFCYLLAASTVLDYSCGVGIAAFPRRKKLFIVGTLCGNLGLLAVFKYFNFFVANFQALGLFENSRALEILLPAGISFYTFQSISYTIDVYRGIIPPKRNFIEFALFVSFFPQLMAGPIERAGRLLAKIEKPRIWNTELFLSAFSLFLIGYFKKLVVADNVAVWVDRVFMLEHPSISLLFVGSIGFAIQIFADFSAYTDIARGSARLLGFDLMENFNAPYLATSPSDFWRRWHISFSTWIRDYLYIPLGGSRVTATLKFAWILTVTMGLSGLWHGAAWNFVAWGLYHAGLLFGYHQLGLGGKWEPRGWAATLTAWSVFQTLTIFGWTLFRAPSLGWLWSIIKQPAFEGTEIELMAAAFLLLLFFGYAALWITHYVLNRWWPNNRGAQIAWQWSAVTVLALLANRSPQQFIYFQF